MVKDRTNTQKEIAKIWEQWEAKSFIAYTLDAPLSLQSTRNAIPLSESGDQAAKTAAWEKGGKKDGAQHTRPLRKA